MVTGYWLLVTGLKRGKGEKEKRGGWGEHSRSEFENLKWVSNEESFFLLCPFSPFPGGVSGQGRYHAPDEN
jgi:hypothetical protein